MAALQSGQVNTGWTGSSGDVLSFSTLSEVATSNNFRAISRLSLRPELASKP